MVTPSFTCQNPNHHHHRSHFAGYRYPVEDTVIEESTASSIVTVINAATSSSSSTSSSRPNDTTTPDIILTKHSNSDECDQNSNVDDTLSTLATHSLSMKTMRPIHETDDSTTAAVIHGDSSSVSSSNSNLSHSNEAGTVETIQKNFPNFKRTNPTKFYHYLVLLYIKKEKKNRQSLCNELNRVKNCKQNQFHEKNLFSFFVCVVLFNSFD